MSLDIRYFSNYLVLGELGQGGAGVVYQARQTLLNRPSALKVLRAGLGATEDTYRGFLREVEAAATLHHPHIVQLYEAGQHEGRLFLSMQLVGGGTLAERLMDGPLAPEEAAKVLLPLAEAVHFAHEHGVLHRDIKPANILLGEQGEPYLTDFGVAKMVQEAAGGDQEIVTAGTPAYMAPEVAGLGARAATMASDIYALGAVFYEMLTGRRVHGDGAPREVMVRVQSRAPSRPSELQPSVPRDIEAICLKCLEREPGQRYSSAAELAADLRRFLSREPVTARAYGWVELVSLWCRRHPLRAGVTVAIVLAVGIGLSAVLVLWHQAERAKAEKNQVLTKLHRQNLDQMLRLRDDHLALDQMGAALRQNPGDRVLAQRAVALLASRDFPLPITPPMEHSQPVVGGGFVKESGEVFTVAGSSVRFWDTRTGSARLTLEAGEGLVSAICSPESGALAAIGGSGAVYLWPSNSTGSPMVITNAEALCSVVFARQGTTLVALGQTGTLREYAVRGGQLMGATNWAGLWRAAAAQPGGRLMAALDATGALRFLDLETRSENGRSVMSDQRARYICFTPCGSEVLLSGDGDSRSFLVEVATRKLAARQFARPTKFGLAAFSPDGLQLAASSGANSVGIWSVPGRRMISERLSHAGQVTGLAFSEDATRLLTVSRDGLAMIWTVLSGESRPAFFSGAANPTVCRFSVDGRLLASGGRDGGVLAWDVENGREVLRQHSHTSAVLAVAFRATPAVLAAISQDGQVSQADLGNGRLLEGMRLPEPVRLARFSADGKCLIGAGSTGHCWLLDLGSSPPASQSLVFPGVVADVAFSPDSSRAAIAGEAGFLKVLEMPNGKVIAERHGTRPLTRVVFDLTGRRLAVALADGGVQVFEVARLAETPLELPQSGGVSDLAFSGDHQLMVGCRTREVRLWDLMGSPPASLSTGMTEGVLRVGFFADGLPCVLDEKGGVNTLDREMLLPIATPLRVVNTSRQWAFSPDRRQLATDDRSGVVFVWEPPLIPVPVPEWFASFLEVLGGMEEGAGGQLFSAPSPKDLFEMCERLRVRSGEDFYTRFTRWFLSDRLTRTAAFEGHESARNYARRLAQVGSQAHAQYAAQMDPTLPEILQAQARTLERAPLLFSRSQVDYLNRRADRLAGKRAPQVGSE